MPVVELHKSGALATLPGYKRELQLKELKAARAAEEDALVAVYMCARERDWLFFLLNVLEIVGESLGSGRTTFTSI